MIFKELKSFKCAMEGLIYGFKTQMHMKFHCLVAIVVVSLGFKIQLTHLEWMLILGVIALVFITEMINTAIECSVDLSTTTLHPLAKAAKDCAAAAVLIASLLSLYVGYLVFYEPINKMFFGRLN